MFRINAPILFHYQNASPLIRKSFRSHMNYEIYYFHNGKGSYLIGDNIFTLQPGDLFIVRGNTLHCPHIDSQYTYMRTTLHFEPAYVRELLSPLHSTDALKPFTELGYCRLRLTGNYKSEVEKLLQRMGKFYGEKEAVSDRRFVLALLDLLHLIFRLCVNRLEQKAGLPSDKERHVQKMIAYVEQHFHEDISMEHLVESVHLSKPYISKLFKEVTGMTLFKYVYKRRIDQAKTLFLLENKRSVTEVCFQVGFKHPAHFSRSFKKLVGCTPEQFRRVHMQ